MKSASHGKHTSLVEVSNVSKHGLWLLLEDRELFLPFKEFPWFREAPVGKLMNVERPSPHHLYWPDLDVDLAIESIEHPERYPLMSQIRPSKSLKPRRSAHGSRRVPRGRAR